MLRHQLHYDLAALQLGLFLKLTQLGARRAVVELPEHFDFRHGPRHMVKLSCEGAADWRRRLGQGGGQDKKSNHDKSRSGAT